MVVRPDQSAMRPEQWSAVVGGTIRADEGSDHVRPVCYLMNSAVRQ